MKKFLQKKLRLRDDVGFHFYVSDFFFRKILRQNRGVKWAIHHTSTIRFPEKLVVGVHSFPGDSPGNYIDARNGIFIGDYTNFGPNVGVISSNHDVVDNTLHLPDDPVHIGKFCWLGMNCVILPGVSLGDFTIVGAGTIVTKSFPDGYQVLAGNPARCIKTLDKETCDAYRKSKS